MLSNPAILSITVILLISGFFLYKHISSPCNCSENFSSLEQNTDRMEIVADSFYSENDPYKKGDYINTSAIDLLTYKNLTSPAWAKMFKWDNKLPIE
jgi:hypothetical protein